MIKKLDILIIRSFIGPFVVTFFITLFVFVMQFFWVYMDELLGKGFGIWMITKLLVYMSTTLVPLALPLAVLLSSIMTFGNMGENFELVAIKSAGISLLRIMRPLFVVIVFLGIGAFFINNNIIPYANLKAFSLLYDMRSKPALNIREGQFNDDIKGYSIRIGHKDRDGITIRDIIIYDHTSGIGNDKVIIAKKGMMMPSPDKQYLIFKLQDGWRYEEKATDYSVQNKEQIRMHFQQWDKVFDLSSFKLARTNEDLFKNAYQMLNINQLTEGIDSFQRQRETTGKTVSGYLGPYISIFNSDKEKAALEKRMATVAEAKLSTYDSSFIERIPDSLRGGMVQAALGQARNSKGMLTLAKDMEGFRQQNLKLYEVEWHRKFTLSFACILLFLAGAPLGAIIRKGGLGMPLIVAIVFYIFFYIMSQVGEKLAETGAVSAGIGMWMSTAMLLPIAFLLIQQARNDSRIFSKEWYLRLWQRIIKLFGKKKTA